MSYDNTLLRNPLGGGTWLSSQLTGQYAAANFPPGIQAYTSDLGMLTNNGVSWVGGAQRKLTAKLRALVAQSQTSNPATAQPLIQPSAYPGSTTAVTKGQAYSNGGNNYIAIVGGTTGSSTPPTETTNAATTDGTVSWYYAGPTFTSNANAPTFTCPASALGGSSVYWTNTNGTRTDSTASRIRDTSNFLITGSAYTDGGSGGAIIGASTGLLTQVSFITDATTFMVAANGGSAPNCQFYVNGVPLTLAYGSTTVPSQSAFFWKFVFATQAPRQITFEIVSPLAFYGVITLDGTSKVWAPSNPNSVRLAIVGTSYFAGSTQHPVTQSLSIGSYMAKLLNCGDCWIDPSGAGTGYIATSATTNYSAATRFNAMVAYNPDVLIVSGGGINDRSQVGITTAIEQAAIVNYLIQARAALPAVPIIVIGSEAGATGPATNVFQMELAAAQAVAQFNDPLVTFIPQSSTVAEKAWLSGTGTTAATNGSGNSDVYIGADGIHPVQAGCLYLAQQPVNAIVGWLNSLVL